MAGGTLGVEEEGKVAATAGASEIKSDAMSVSADAVLFISTKTSFPCSILGYFFFKGILVKIS
jgi:hypothetical protein